MSRKLIIALACAFILADVTGNARAEISPEQIARLGADLTPFGGERAGNAGEDERTGQRDHQVFILASCVL